MQKRKPDEKGFTLIEVIVTLILVGITAALAGMWIVSVANGYVFTKMNANTVQNGQLAMTRLAKEFSAIQSVSSSGSDTITYTRATTPTNPSATVTISQIGNTLQINVDGAGNSTLTDNVDVGGFTLRYCDTPDLTTCPDTTWSSSSRIIEITLKLTGPNNTPSEFTRRATPRNL